MKRVVDVWEEAKQQVFLEILNRNINKKKTKLWEEGVAKKKSEASKSQSQRYVEDRKKTIYEMLKNNVNITLEDLERGIIERGFSGIFSGAIEYPNIY